MTKQEFVEIKDGYIDNLTKYFKDSGDLFPHLAIFAKHKQIEEEDSDKPSIIHIPIPNDLLKTGHGKDKFIELFLDMIVPEVKQKFKIYGIAWSAEAWMKTSDKIPDDIDKLPVKDEVIIISIESDFLNECNIYQIERAKMNIKDDGQLVVDEINLNKLPSPDNIPEGRFSNLYEKIKD